MSTANKTFLIKYRECQSSNSSIQIGRLDHAGDFVFPDIIDEVRISQNEAWHPKIFGVFRRGMRKHAITLHRDLSQILTTCFCCVPSFQFP